VGFSNQFSGPGYDAEYSNLGLHRITAITHWEVWQMRRQNASGNYETSNDQRVHQSIMIDSSRPLATLTDGIFFL